MRISFSSPGRRLIAVIGLALLAGSAFAAETVSLDRLDEALKSAAAYQYGANANALVEAEQIIVDAANDPALRGKLEEHLLKALAAPLTRDAKEFVVRQFFTYGTARSIPQLEALLTDPELAHVARRTLGRYEYPEADAALRRALAKTSGRLQAGIVNTLGDRRCTAALPEIKPLLGASDPVVVQAAVTALGQIGGGEAVKALEAARAQATPELSRRIDDALLVAAEGFTAAKQTAAARAVYQSLYAAERPGTIRAAALRGLAITDGEHATALLVECLKGADPVLKAAAVEFTQIVPGAAATRTFAELLPSLEPEMEELLLKALAARNDPAALPAVVAAAKSQNTTVRIAACETLGTLGDPTVVAFLVSSAAEGSGAVQQAARAALVQLHRGAVDPAIAQTLTAAEPKKRIEALKAMAGRKTVSAFDEILKLAEEPDPAVRREAIRSLGVLADEQKLGRLLALAVKLKEAADLEAVEQAGLAVFQKIPTPDRQAAPVLALLAEAPAAAKPVLLGLLGRTVTPPALAALRAALKDENPLVREAAVRALADWPTAEPAEDLLAQVGTTAGRAVKVIALRAYVRMAGLSKDPAPMYSHALELATRPEDKKLILSSLGAAEPKAAAPLVEPFLQNEDLRAEAALAAIQVADKLRQSDLGRAKALVLSAMKVATEANTRAQGQEVLNQIGRFEGHILDWVAAGPYRQPDKNAAAIFDVAFAPEQPGATDVKWTRVTKGLGAWDVNLGEALGEADDVAGYLRTYVWSPVAQPVRLECGSDDAIKVWLNQTVVHGNNTERGHGPGQDIAPANLKAGWNELLLKVINRAGGWYAACRIRQPDGQSVEGLKYEAR